MSNALRCQMIHTYCGQVELKMSLSVVLVGFSVTAFKLEGVWLIWDHLRISCQSAGSRPILIK